MNPFITPQDLLEKDFFELLGLEGMDPQKKRALLIEMGKTIHALVYSDIFSQLSEEDRATLDTIPEDGIIGFLQKKGFNIPAMFFAEAQRYKAEMIATLAEAAQEIPELTQ